MDTEKELIDRHRTAELAQKAADRALAARYVARTAVMEKWSLDDMDEVLQALGIHPSLG